jgi:hypothetical protein
MYRFKTLILAFALSLLVIVLLVGGYILEREINWGLWYGGSVDTATEKAIQEHEHCYHANADET